MGIKHILLCDVQLFLDSDQPRFQFAQAILCIGSLIGGAIGAATGAKGGAAKPAIAGALLAMALGIAICLH